MEPTAAGSTHDRGIAGRVLNRVVGTFVSPVVDSVDVGSVVDRIDLDEVLSRVDVNELIDRIDLNVVLDRIDVNELLDRIEPDRLLDRVDANRLLDRVEPDRLLDRVEPNRLLDRVDPDRLLDRVDANRLIDRVDVDRLIAKVDADALLERVDLNRVVERTELGAIIARSTSGAFTQVLDVARTRVVSADQMFHVTVAHLLRRPGRGRPARPGEPADIPDLDGLDARKRAIALQGHYAGAVSRFLAFLADQALIGVGFALIVALVRAAAEIVLGRELDNLDHRWLAIASYGLFWFLYMTVQLAATGRTIGKTLSGLVVVDADGHELHPRRAALRTVAFPLSFLFFGAGFLIGLVRPDRRQFHDLVGRTAVLYAWDARTADLRAS